MGEVEKITTVVDRQLNATVDVTRLHLQLLDDYMLHKLAGAIGEGRDLSGFNITLPHDQSEHDLVRHLAAESVLREFTRRRDIAGLNELYG